MAKKKSIRNVSLDDHANFVLSRVGNKNVSSYLEKIVKLRERECSDAMNALTDYGVSAKTIVELCAQRNFHVLQTDTGVSAGKSPDWLRIHHAGWTLVEEWWCGNEFLKTQLTERARNEK